MTILSRVFKTSFRGAAATAACVTAIFMASAAERASAQTSYPTRPVRIVVPFPAGGTTDMLARLFAAKLQSAFNQSFVVENIGGAGGSTGADNIAKATPDGHALLFHNLTFPATSVAMTLAGRARHDILKDFAPVSLGANVPLVILVPASLPVKDMKEFVAYAKAAKDPLFYGSTGPGSVMNMSGEVLKRDAGIKLEHVPFRGAAPLVQELIAGRVQLGGDQLSTSLEHVRAGTMKAIATIHPTRMALLPDVPTVRELGYPNMEVSGWNGFFAPAGTPAAVIDRIQGAIRDAVADPDVRAKMLQVGAEPIGSTPAELGRLVAGQVEQLTPIIRDIKLVAPQ